ATGRHVKVVLSGIGGDETFAGYPRYLGLRFSELYAALPRPLRMVPAAAARRLVRESEASRSWGNWIRRFLDAADQPLPDRYLGWTRFFSDRDLERLATPALRRRWRESVDDAQRRAFGGLGHDDPVDGAFRIDLSTYLPDDLLVMADRMSMAHSLELRAPFCDHHVIELSHRLAPAAKLPRLRLKGLLKAAFADVLPLVVLGGAERVVWEQASRLGAAGHRVRVVSRAPENVGPGGVVHRDVPVRHFAVDRRTLRSFIRTSILEARRAVVDEVDAHGADVLHLHQPLAAFGALTSPAGRRLPSLYTFHSPAPLE